MLPPAASDQRQLGTDAECGTEILLSLLQEVQRATVESEESEVRLACSHTPLASVDYVSADEGIGRLRGKTSLS